MWWRSCQIQEMSTQLERYKWVLLNDILEVHSNQLEGTLKSILNFLNFENLFIIFCDEVIVKFNKWVYN